MAHFKSQHTDNDEQLLRDFFAEHRETIADNGFTERVLAALPEQQEEAARLRRWNLALNGIGIVAAVVMMIAFGTFGWLRTAMMSMARRVLVGIVNFDWDALLVQFMLLLHRLPEMLPSPQQMLALVLVLISLTVLAAERLKSSYR